MGKLQKFGSLKLSFTDKMSLYEVTWLGYTGDCHTRTPKWIGVPPRNAFQLINWTLKINYVLYFYLKSYINYFFILNNWTIFNTNYKISTYTIVQVHFHKNNGSCIFYYIIPYSKSIYTCINLKFNFGVSKVHCRGKHGQSDWFSWTALEVCLH